MYFYITMKSNLSSRAVDIVFGVIVFSGFMPIMGVSAQGGLPSVSTSSPLNVFSTGATLQGVVNPNNSSTIVFFEYGPAQSLGFITPTFAVGDGGSETNYSAIISNLSTNTVYYYRAVAQNGYGHSRGQIFSFTTQPNQTQQFQNKAPLVTTNPVSSFSPVSVTLYGSANPNNSSTTVWFEYGSSGYLGNATSKLLLGSSNSYQGYSSTVFNLSSNTTYYYRAVAQNSYGTVYGALLTFAVGAGREVNLNNQDLSGIADSLTQLTEALTKLSGQVGGLDVNHATERVVKKTEISSDDNSDLAKLTFTADKEKLNPGDKVVFIIKVDPSANLTNAVLTVKLNSGFEFDSTNVSSYSKSEDAIAYKLASVSSHSAQVFKINARLASDFNKDNADNDIVTSTATFAYADANNNGRTALSSSLSAKIGGGGFFAGISDALPGGATVAILLIALLILLIAVAIRKLLN